MKVLIINGPNINLLGIREPNIYGNLNYSSLKKYCKEEAKKLDIKVKIYQSNHEGDLIDQIQKAYFKKYDGIIINAGGYTHTSIAILDALKGVNIPTIEVHLSDITKREDFRKNSYISKVSIDSFIGLGFEGYKKALQKLKEVIK